MSVNRREFLSATGKAGLAFHIVAGFPALGSPGKPKIGMCDWNLGPSCDPEMIPKAREANIAGIQVSVGISPDNIVLRDPKVRKRYLELGKQYGVAFNSVAAGSILNKIPLKSEPQSAVYVIDAVETAAVLGAKNILIAFFGNGDLFYLAGDNQVSLSGAGNWFMTGDDAFSFNATAYSTGGTSEGVSGSGIYNEDGLFADYTGLEQLVAIPAASFQRGLTTSKLAGTYFIVDYFTPSGFGSATVASDGTVSGTTNDGCDINGRFEVPNSLFNQAYMNLEVVNCPNARQITGAATYDKDRQSILAMGNDGQSGYIWSFDP